MLRYVINTLYDGRRLRRRPRLFPHLLPSDSNSPVPPQPTARNTRKLPQTYTLRPMNHIQATYLDSDAVSKFQGRRWALGGIWKTGRRDD